MKKNSAILNVFPTLIYKSRLTASSTSSRNISLLSAIEKISNYDKKGHKWSEKNFPGGYTSYSSLSQLFELSTEFQNLKNLIDNHAKKFASSLYWNIKSKDLKMTSMWINVVPKGCSHSLHLHPLSVISGTYYVKLPEKKAEIKFEDPRLSKFMAAPSRKASCPKEMNNFYSLNPQEGDLVLFESWIRHEVPQNLSPNDRISISFNYSL